MGINLHPMDNPPQKTYLHKLKNDRAIIVYTNAKTGDVRGFIYSSKGLNYLMRIHKKNIQ